MNQKLAAFFAANPGGALACSGGVDSVLLLWAAARYGQGWRAYIVRSAFQPVFELDDARRAAGQCGLPLTVVEADVLAVPAIAANPADRCYCCKRQIFTRLLEAARADGCSLVIDGTNASDDAGDRPGMRALRELGVRSPLRECGLTKEAVRRLSREAGLFTWDKPSYACLATRIPTGTPITAVDLARVEEAETRLFALGFRDLRVRLVGSAAVVQLPRDQLDRAWTCRDQLLAQLRPLFPLVTLDLAPRRGSD